MFSDCCDVKTMILRYLLSFIVLINQCRTINITRIVDEYIAVCGELICEKGKRPLVSPLMSISKRHPFCDDCSCDISCVTQGNCCPDLFLSLRLNCTQTNIVEGPALNEPILMIDSCPENTTMEEKQKCMVSEDRAIAMQSLPVTSQKTSFVYRNIDCLRCNNESTDDAMTWELKIECTYIEMSALNFLSSYDEIVEHADIYNCSISYVDLTKHRIKPRKCIIDAKSDAQSAIRSCNVSGTWKNYDPDIDVACQTYDHEFYSFKNVFCYICNPPYNHGNRISRCNATGLWKGFGVDLERACSETQSSPVTGEFKNIYCYMCNVPNLLLKKKKYIHLQDAVVNVKDKTYSVDKFEFEFEIRQLSLRQIIDTIINRHGIKQEPNLPGLLTPTFKPVPNLPEPMPTLTNDTDNTKMLNIYTKYFALTGKAHFCHNHSLFTDLDQCNCDEHCGVQAFHNQKCCIDMLFTRTTMCTEKEYSWNGRRYLVYDGCNKSTNTILQELCHRQLEDTIFSYLPSTFHGGFSNIYYKNIFCLLCDQEKTINKIFKTNLKNEVTLWNFEISCDIYIPIYYHVSLERFIRFAQKNGCNLYFEPTGDECESDMYNNKCNTSGNLLTEDTDITWACEHLNVLPGRRNEFCIMCNPMDKTNRFISTCNETGLWETYDEQIEGQCIKMPLIEYHVPYKNIFCMQCNGITEYILPDPTSTYSPTCIENANGTRCTSDIEEGKIHKATFRVLFSLVRFDKDSNKKEGICTAEQIYNNFEVN